MKLCRFNNNRVGLVEGDDVYDITDFADNAEKESQTECFGDSLVAVLPIIKSTASTIMAKAPRSKLSTVKLLSPIRRPGKVMVTGQNYLAHITEMQGRPSARHGARDIDKPPPFFVKAASSVIGPSEGIALRFLDRRTEHEVELVPVIGRTVSDVSAENALDYVAGYCIGLDISLRGPEESSLRKSIDGYSVIGPWLVTSDEIGDPQKLNLSLHVNGALRQGATTADMITSVARLIEFASKFFTLYPGDIIFTGTPQGVAPIAPGDILRAECDCIGQMEVAVRTYVPAS